MARPESGIYLDVCGVVRDESAIVRIKVVDYDAVLAEVRDVGETILLVRVN